MCKGVVGWCSCGEGCRWGGSCDWVMCVRGGVGVCIIGVGRLGCRGCGWCGSCVG